MYANRLSLGVVHECYIMQNIFCLNEWKSLKQISSFITIIIKHQQLVTLYKNVYCCRTSIQLNVFVMSYLFIGVLHSKNKRHNTFLKDKMKNQDTKSLILHNIFDEKIACLAFNDLMMKAKPEE